MVVDGTRLIDRVGSSFPAVLAIVDISTGYQILGVLHVLAVIVAFGPLFIYPSMQRAGAGPALARLHLRLVLPALTLVWVLGMGMVGMSDEVWEMATDVDRAVPPRLGRADGGQLVPDPAGADRHSRNERAAAWPRASGSPTWCWW